MSSSDYLLKATINRLTARLSQKIVDSVANLALISQEAPEKIRKEWELFQEEVNEEADRLDNEKYNDKGKEKEDLSNEKIETSQETIDRLRSKISALESSLNDFNR